MTEETATEYRGEFTPIHENTSPLGIWSDGSTMWVSDTIPN